MVRRFIPFIPLRAVFKRRARGISGLGCLVSTPWTHKSFINKRRLDSQAGRRGFESRLPLQCFGSTDWPPLSDQIPAFGERAGVKGILRKVNKALTALRLAASRKASMVDEAILLDAPTEALL